ncbi:hypothetical protein FHS56_001065 [Thermonema lapsum]|uniref:Uncharacterized protein n=1 Tax=Thermonema lapsum TaxID=28195 RepID=A0A846MQ44_9BACT|nr:hypothetical protein [Thermonema lapsum]
MQFIHQQSVRFSKLLVLVETLPSVFLRALCGELFFYHRGHRGTTSFL